MLDNVEISDKKNNQPNPVICLDNVRVIYGSLVALNDINFDIHKGEIVGICGPNGSGKTTLLKTILGQIKPFQGSVKIFGRDIADTGMNNTDKMRIGYVPQVHSIDRHFPALVEDVVMMGRYSKIGIMNRPTKMDWDIVYKALEAVHMEKFTKRPIGHLSGGQQQKVMIARALAQEPQILLLDEPTSALDFKIADEVMKVILELRRKYDLTIVMVQHNIELLQTYSDRLICLNVKVAFDGDPNDNRIPDIIQRVFFS